MTGSSTQQGPAPAPTDETGRFVSVVLASTEDVWSQAFQQAGRTYQPPKLVLYSGRIDTACGLGAAASGPFYCPGDQRLYIDLSFFQLMRERLGAPGDFAQAYVVAHEVGHHVQNLLGTMDQMERARGRASEQQYNALSVRLELQADCYAGVWANHSQQARNWLEKGDVEEGMGAASAVGDDRLQKQSQGTVVPESFTHGSSAQRVRWFRTGLESGRASQCDTFSARTL
jgi:predicted metalloprotease